MFFSKIRKYNALLREDLSNLTHYGAKLQDGEVVFGCGAVSFTKSEIKSFNKVRKQLENYELRLSESDKEILNKHFL